ncbi:MAG: HAMP domain-containing sensor histidine kinase [Leptolyngbya sp.]|nr:HAMP domain-containing sensor histidine kinase [Leptolyngbya sp.]
MPRDLNWETCQSAGQLQLMGVVQRWGAAAGWIVEDGARPGSDGNGDGCAAAEPPIDGRPYAVVVSGVVMADLPPVQRLISSAFLAQRLPLCHELQPEVWGFCQRASACAEGWIEGLRFRLAPSAPWLYLLLWFPDPLGSGGASGAKSDGPNRDSGGRTGGTARLISEVAALRTALRLDQDTQRQRQQVAQYQQILRRLEHQLRHPLAMVHLYAANLQNGLTSDQDRQQAQTIREAVGHLSDHLTDLIAGCQRSPVQTEACGVSSLWAEAWQGLQLLAQTQEVRLVLSDQPLTLWGDRAQLVQAFTNLLHNALCFSPPQGQITVQWQGFQREVVITLADQGPGLSPSDLQNLFRPYYSNRPQGSGLGLTIARQIVQQHGGKLWAENLPQGGAQFSLALPLAPDLCPPNPAGGAGEAT